MGRMVGQKRKQSQANHPYKEQAGMDRLCER